MSRRILIFLFFFLAILGASAAFGQSGFYTVTTPYGSQPVPGLSFVCGSDGTLYFADYADDLIFKLTSDGTLSTLAGGGYHSGYFDAVGTAARFNGPTYLIFDNQNNLLVVDNIGHTIRKVTPGGLVSTFAGDVAGGFRDGPVGSALFGYINSIAKDSAGNIYVVEVGSLTIRVISTAGFVSTLSKAPLDSHGIPDYLPFLVAVDSKDQVYLLAEDRGVLGLWKIGSDGSRTRVVVDKAISGPDSQYITPSVFRIDSRDNFYICDRTSIWKFTPNGPASNIGEGVDVAFDSSGNTYLLGDPARIDATGHPVTRIATDGTSTEIKGRKAGFADGIAGTARFSQPLCLVRDTGGNIYVADSLNNAIRKISPDGSVTTLAGGTAGFTDGYGSHAQFNQPYGIVLGRSGVIYVADQGNNAIRAVSHDGEVTTVAGFSGAAGRLNGPTSIATFNAPMCVVVDKNDAILVGDVGNHTIRRIFNGQVETIDVGYVAITGMIFDPAGDLILADGSVIVKLINLASNPQLELLAGSEDGFSDGMSEGAMFWLVCQMAIDGDGNLFVTDSYNGSIRKVTPAGLVTTIAGNGTPGFSDGVGPRAHFYDPRGICFGDKGELYVADGFNHSIRKLTPPSVPIFSTQPMSVSATGGTVALNADATGSTRYQWFLNGAPIPGASSSILILPDASTAVGDYSCKATNSAGTTASATATVSLSASSDFGHLINLSCRAEVGINGNILIAGFVISGSGTSGSQPLLIRASGPALAQFAVTDVLPDPAVSLFHSTTLLASNSGWAGSKTVFDAATAVGAFAWSDFSSKDSALLQNFAGGPYTAHVAGETGDTGVSLVEIYDATPLGTFTASSPHLVNISARVNVGTGGNTLIAGFVIGGATAKTVLLRASGPALVPFGVTGVLPDPQLRLYRTNNDGTSTLLLTNQGWGGSPQISTVADSVGAFSWGTTETLDSALVITLSPGAYTAQVSGISGDTGIALVEVYEIP